ARAGHVLAGDRSLRVGDRPLVGRDARGVVRRLELLAQLPRLENAGRRETAAARGPRRVDARAAPEPTGRRGSVSVDAAPVEAHEDEEVPAHAVVVPLRPARV